MTDPASSEAIDAADEMLLDELYRGFGLIHSYAASGLEATRRGDREEVRLRLAQIRDSYRFAVEARNLLSPPAQSEKARAA